MNLACKKYRYLLLFRDINIIYQAVSINKYK